LIEMKDAAAVFTHLLTHASPPYIFWRSPEGEIWVGGGMSDERVPRDPKDWRGWLSRPNGTETAPARLPQFLLLGFDPVSSAGGNWEGFPLAQLFRPAIGYHLDGNEETFFGLEAGDIPEVRSAEAAAFPVQGQIHIPDWAAEQYVERVRRGLQRIEAGAFQKIVLARSIGIELTTAFAPARALASLQQQPHSFAICYSPDGSRFFLSATPERLGRVRNGRFTTMALAGTMTRQRVAQDGFDTLLLNAKERAEHAYVTEMIRTELAAFADDVQVDDVQLLTLPHITHILTHMKCVLHPGRGMLDVVSALHPTPAVAGTPRVSAGKAIPELESFQRGLYAGCIGWVDARGNGDAAVAIRSAVVHGKTAHAFAGAGIVAESDPLDEERETRAKLQTILDILGS
jgi:isochorismate synthase